jgi:hypothetical protein
VVASATASLWAGVVVIGVYHGLNPAMGWPLAVANGLGEKRDAAVFATWVPLGAGHLLAMALVLVPFALLTWMLQWGHEIRVGAGALVLLFGVSRLLLRRHPRWFARIRPTQLALWSFLMATAHGAALMLLPILMGLCETPAATGVAAPISTLDHAAVMELMRSSVGMAVMVSLVHTVAMIGSGLGVAWVVYRYLGLRALRAAWLDLDSVWALGLIASGVAAVAMALSSTH